MADKGELWDRVAHRYGIDQRDVDWLTLRYERFDNGELRPTAWKVTYLINGELCEKLFTDEWRAVAFRDGCEERHRAHLETLYS